MQSPRRSAENLISAALDEPAAAGMAGQRCKAARFIFDGT
jgi:hypothetical protein